MSDDAVLPEGPRRWLNDLPVRWRRRLQATIGERSPGATDFGHRTTIRFEDGSEVSFLGTLVIGEEGEGEVAVLTEHCGYHVFPVDRANVVQADV